tara:strand:- start:421 stop:540 length:120 start_codon:yes stop_codon:yes gene_type:complete
MIKSIIKYFKDKYENYKLDKLYKKKIKELKKRDPFVYKK